ncbi:hypothetical protein EDB92DRAFT_1948005 [Lactarius akahatsu]|uniref:Uncharacterized protein n=1 Tax=Lactarius akahatsu TaxID=416441 RepID=A0AAD4LDZ7_9AGAM|nr:hypothetical protein EDB92DRAFT_1948005 [Lactarius akahatsu]
MPFTNLREVSPSPSGIRATHSRQMSSLSMTTLTTSQSHYPSEPLLRNADHREAHAQQPPHPDTSVEDRRYWEKVSARRMRRLRLLKGALWSIIGSWASYTTIRYFIAYAVYSESGIRQSVALSLGISSLLSLLVAAALALSVVVPRHFTLSRPLSRSLGKSLRHVSQFLASFFLFVPAAVNLALVFSWRNTGSELSLRGRCHWSLDVVWVGVGGQCTPHAPAWGVWLAAAVSRFVLTAAILITYHLVSRAYRASRWLHYCATDGQRRDTVDITRMEPGDTPSRPSPVLQPFIPKKWGVRNQIPLHYEHEYAGLDSVDSSTLSEDDSLPRSVESSSSPSRRAALVSNVGEGELGGFADRFRALVDRVSLELEEARNLESEPPPRTPPLHHVLDTHTPYMSIDEFGREVHTEEPVAMFGGVIRRMPTIDSVGSRELASLRSTMLVSACGGVAGPPSIAPSSSTSSRPPTRATMVSFNDAASASLASASAQSSRSNSIHRPRMPSELGEIGSASARPGSGGSGGAGNIETASAPPRSRSNSQGANEVLAPVTEHGEHPDGAPRSWAPRRLCDTPEQLLAAGASELGELVMARPGTARSRSLGSSSPSRSATSTTYFTAGTGSSGDTGTSGSGGGGGAPR